MKNINITVDDWNNMTIEEQNQFIMNNNIKVYSSTDVCDGLTIGFGNLDDYGFWEYQCKNYCTNDYTNNALKEMIEEKVNKINDLLNGKNNIGNTWTELHIKSHLNSINLEINDILKEIDELTMRLIAK